MPDTVLPSPAGQLAPDAVAAAAALREQGRLDDAEAACRARLAAAPDDWRALLELGLCARMRRDLAASAAHLAAALGLAPGERPPRFEYATTLREQARLDDAEAEYRALLAADAGDWQALEGLGLCARMRRDLPASAAHLAAALGLAPGKRSPRFEYATTLREQARLDAAEAEYRALLAADAGDWRALAGLGLCARMRRDLPASADHLAAALALAPRDRSVRFEYATTLREQARLDAAEAEYRALLAADAGDWQALEGLGLCARTRRDLPASAAHLAAALALVPRDRSVRFEYATTLREQARPDEAEPLYRALLADAPDDWRALVGLGLCARIRDDRAGAIARFTVATAVAPDAAEPWCELAEEHCDAGRFDAARAILRALIGRGRGGAEAWVGLGHVERTAGDRAAAARAFQEAHALAPARHELAIDIALEEQALGHFAEAERWLRQAAAIEPVAGAALLLLGELARARQQVAEALELFGEAARRPGAPVRVHAMIAQTLADAGRPDEALRVLDEAERRHGGAAELAVKRIALLRRAGLRQEALALARDAVAAAPRHFPLWIEWFETERYSGDFAGIDRCLAAAPAASVHERAHLWLARGHLAAQRWQPEAAVAAYREALAGNPQLSEAHEALARASLLRCDVATARAHLDLMRRQRAAHQLRQGLSPHLTHTHIGNLFDEFAMDGAALAALAQAQAAAPADRVGPLLALARAAPDHTPTAIALMVALRQAGRFAEAGRDAGGAAIPATIVQYWDEPAPPGDVAALMQSWRAHNPGHRYLRFDRAAAQAFLRARYPAEVLLAYRRAREPAMQADLFRLAWLFAEGGCYADADDRCLRPLGALLAPGASFVAFQEEYGTLGNNFLAAAPRHPLCGLALRLAVRAIGRGDDDMMWLATGPGLITRAFARLLAGDAAPAAWLGRSRILDRHELECVVATHCTAAYKNSRRHWLRATFGEPRPTGQGALPPAPPAKTENLQSIP
jgi:predicted Zn-dependent protease